MARLARFLPEDHEPLVADLADRFEMVSSMADGQRESLHGVIEFFQTRVSTHLTIASDDLAQTSVRQNDDMRKISAWVAIIAVPTAVTGFMGQNVPYPGFGTADGFYASTTVMLIMAIVLYVFFRRKEWL
jgi:Mg2+ and Co2+ transporter CorA